MAMHASGAEGLGIAVPYCKSITKNIFQKKPLGNIPLNFAKPYAKDAMPKNMERFVQNQDGSTLGKMIWADCTARVIAATQNCAMFSSFNIPNGNRWRSVQFVVTI